ncbi:hypothetical protein [Aeromicrobium sp. CTD01-1L150]|uniref:hypothetical protein n=1 Tax=Aeromicrobium sp. CTD01-1L150 TaxID=3341830 RepID=UPI0035C1FEAC
MSPETSTPLETFMPSRHLLALALVVAASALLLYPILRGYAVEDGTDAAQLYARSAWLWSHVLAMGGFALVAWGLSAVDVWAHRLAVVGVALLLPYYGAEAFGLHAMGRRVLETGTPEVLQEQVGAADLFRFEPVAVTTFGLGWLALAVVGVRLLLMLRPAGRWERTGLVLTAAALLTYLPQFFLPPAGRIAHAVVAAVGLGLLAIMLARGSDRTASATSSADPPPHGEAS